MTRLYELTDELAALQEAAEAGEDVGGALATIGDAIEAKAEGVLHVLRNLEADATACEAEADRLKAKAKTRERAVQRIRDYVRSCMQLAGITRIKGPTFSISLSAGQTRIEVTNLPALKHAAPELVATTTTEAPDKRAILARYKADGEFLPGVEYTPTTTLRVT